MSFSRKIKSKLSEIALLTINNNLERHFRHYFVEMYLFMIFESYSG